MGREARGEVSVSRGGCFAHFCATIQGCEGVTEEEAWAPLSPKKWQQKAATLPAKVSQRPSLYLAWTRSHHVTSLSLTLKPGRRSVTMPWPEMALHSGHCGAELRVPSHLSCPLLSVGLHSPATHTWHPAPSRLRASVRPQTATWKSTWKAFSCPRPAQDSA